MTSSVTSIPQSVLDQIHWDSIVDVCTGKAKTLTEAKAKRTFDLQHYARIKKMGIHDNLVGLYLADPTLLSLTECIMNGGKWGDIWYTDTFIKLQAIETELTALHSSTHSGRWRRAAELYPIRDRLKRDIGYAVD
jgi:hypothetical protein